MDMEKIIKPSDYAKELGISRQAVYAKIKKGILKSKEIDGKLYIVVDNKLSTTKANNKHSKIKQPSIQSNTTSSSTQINNYEELLKAKDETIGVLKDTIKDLKESNKEISTTLRGEIDLLKEAFYEMRTLYANQLENKNSSEIEHIEIIQEKDNTNEDTPPIQKWISVKKFCKEYQIKEKKVDKYKKIFKKLYKKNDTRVFIEEDKIKVDISQDFSDIVDI